MNGKVFLVQGESLGRGEEQLGKILLANLLRLLGESEKKPETIIFVNAGVRLLCEGSAVLEHLTKLEQQGIELLACTTCLEYFDLREKIIVGEATTMSKTIASLMNNEVVSL